MKIFFESFKIFIKKEIVFSISFVLALVSCFFVKPNSNYINYIDVNVLFLLFAFMTVVAGIRDCGVFDICGNFLCRLTSSVRSLGIALVFMCFIFSMLITNDVALLTFVPFSIMLLTKCHQEKNIIFIVVLQTVAANLGSMLTPMGNPQNLFLYSQMNISAIKFCSILLPYTIISAVLLFVFCLKLPALKMQVESNDARKEFSKKEKRLKTIRTFIYILLFALCIFTVLKIIASWLLCLIVLGSVLLVQKKIIFKVDYVLLLTFVCFFIFSGNIQNVEIIKSELQKIVNGKEFVCGILSSQIISNVPATLLLYPFSANAKELLLGVDIGGLGTLVASLASLISYKLYVNSNGAATNGTKFIKVFTLINFIFIVVLVFAKFILEKILC